MSIDGEHRVASGVIKRSLVVAGHATSISLEAPFWEALKAIGESRGVSTSALVAEIDGGRQAANLSSAVRVYVLAWFRGCSPSHSPVRRPSAPESE